MSVKIAGLMTMKIDNRGMFYRFMVLVVAVLALTGMMACGGGGAVPEPVVVQPEETEAPVVELVEPLERVPSVMDAPVEGVQPVTTSEPVPVPAADVPMPAVESEESGGKIDFGDLVASLVESRGDSYGGLVQNDGDVRIQPSTGTLAMGAPIAAGKGGGVGGLRPESGGEANPNANELPLVYFENYGVNPFVDADEDALSTFSLDGDTASYQVGRSYLERGWLPEPDSVRVEEWVNFFAQGYDSPDDGLALVLDGGPSRFGEEGYRVLRVGVTAARPVEEREAVSLVFIVDVSGSMEADDRLGLAKAMMLLLTDMLEGNDRVAVVTYGSEAHVLHEFASADAPGSLKAKIRGLSPGGSTFVESGIREAYALAEPELDAGRNVRLVLFSDGVGNVGETGAEGILALIDKRTKQNATLTSVGVGFTGNYNDVLLEVLANRGNGTYHYVQDSDAAGDFLENNAESIFREVARDARIQVEFNADAVRKYRLIGYENRAVSDEDFRDDTLDFGEIGFTKDVTALYELRLEEGLDASAELATARLRWHDVSSDGVLEVESTIQVGELSDEWSRMGAHLRRSASVAEFAELMRKSFWAQCGSLEAVSEALADVDTGDEDDAELMKLLGIAEGEFESFCRK